MMVHYDPEFYRGKRVFVTGHTGFKGSWLCKMLLMAGAEVTGYSLQPPTQPNLFSIAGVEDKMHSVIGDIRDFDALKAAFDAAQPDIVLHLAAQPIVRDSYKDPRYTYETNVMGTVNLLECVRLARQQGRAPSVCGVDISRDALICAHRRAPELTLAVASIAHLPVADASCDLLLNVFAPHDADEFARVLRPQGVLLRVIPLERHLWGLKCAVYDRPYENEVPDPALPGFALAARRELRGTVTLRSQAEIEALFCMTPYYYKTGARDQAKLRALDTLTTETEFALLIYHKA